VKTLFDEETRYAITPTGTLWKLDEDGFMSWRPPGQVRWYSDYTLDKDRFQRWIDSGAVMEVSSAMYH